MLRRCWQSLALSRFQIRLHGILATVSILLALALNYINRGRVFTMYACNPYISYHLFADAAALYSCVSVCVLRKTNTENGILQQQVCFETGNTRQNHGNMSHSNISLILVLQTNTLANGKAQRTRYKLAKNEKNKIQTHAHTHTQMNTEWEFYTSSNKCSP